MKKVRVVTVVEPSDHEWLVSEVEREGSDMSTVLRRVISDARRGPSMKLENRKWREFDQKISGISSHTVIQKAIIDVHDTLDFCVSAARSIFGDDATPAIALAIFDRVSSRIER